MALLSTIAAAGPSVRTPPLVVGVALTLVSLAAHLKPPKTAWAQRLAADLCYFAAVFFLGWGFWPYKGARITTMVLAIVAVLFGVWLLGRRTGLRTAKTQPEPLPYQPSHEEVGDGVRFWLLNPQQTPEHVETTLSNDNPQAQPNKGKVVIQPPSADGTPAPLKIVYPTEFYHQDVVLVPGEHYTIKWTVWVPLRGAPLQVSYEFVYAGTDRTPSVQEPNDV